MRQNCWWDIYYSKHNFVRYFFQFVGDQLAFAIHSAMHTDEVAVSTCVATANTATVVVVVAVENSSQGHYFMTHCLRYSRIYDSFGVCM